MDDVMHHPGVREAFALVQLIYGITDGGLGRVDPVALGLARQAALAVLDAARRAARLAASARGGRATRAGREPPTRAAPRSPTRAARALRARRRRWATEARAAEEALGRLRRDLLSFAREADLDHELVDAALDQARRTHAALARAAGPDAPAGRLLATAC